MSVVQRWLDSLSPNTRRIYRSGLAAFLSSTIAISGDHDGNLTDAVLRTVNPLKIQGFLNAAQRAGRKPSTVNLYRAALASFYRYAREVEGWTVDPVGGISVHKLTPYGRSRYPTSDQVRQLLAAIPTDTVAGKRDLAIILGLYVTTRRVTEWLTLHGHDIHHSTSDGYWFSYVAKGGLAERQAIPPSLWAHIRAYLVAADRWPLDPTAPLFIRVDAGRKNGVCLSTGYVRRAIGVYGAKAGLPADICHPHGLRHAGARARKEAGQSTWELQAILAHKHLTTTTIYTRQVLDAPKDAFGDAIAKGVWPG